MRTAASALRATCSPNPPHAPEHASATRRRAERAGAHLQGGLLLRGAGRGAALRHRQHHQRQERVHLRRAPGPITATALVRRCKRRNALAMQLSACSAIYCCAVTTPAVRSVHQVSWHIAIRLEREHLALMACGADGGAVPELCIESCPKRARTHAHSWRQRGAGQRSAAPALRARACASQPAAALRASLQTDGRTAPPPRARLQQHGRAERAVERKRGLARAGERGQAAAARSRRQRGPRVLAQQR